MSNSTSSSGDGGSLAAVKSVAIVVELIAGLVAFVPLYLRQRTNARNQDTVFGMVDAVAGGVFLSISLCSMAKDAAHELGEINEDFPLGFLMVGLGFLTIYLIENAIVPTVLRHVRLDETSRQQLNLQLLDDNDDGDRDDLVKHNDDEAIVADGELPAQSQSQPHQKGYNNVTLYAFTVLAAICVHELFEGLAMGIQNDLSAAVVSLIALAIHKSIEAFAVGVAMSASTLERKVMIPLLIFYTCVAPIGVAIGFGISSSTLESTEIISGFIAGFSAGTFLYIAMVTLRESFGKKKWLLTKAGLVTCAFVLMSVMGAFE